VCRVCGLWRGGGAVFSVGLLDFFLDLKSRMIS
jgi:hypothetical protein